MDSRTGRAVRPHVVFLNVLAVLAPLAAPAVTAEVRHPMDPLAEEEYSATLEVLREAGRIDDESLFQTITLHESPKAEVLAWRPGAGVRRSSYVVVKNRDGFYEGVVDLTGRRIASWTRIEGAQPGILLEEWQIAQEVTTADPAWRKAMRSRGIEDFDKLFCIPLTAGNFGAEEEKSRRILRVPCNYLEGSKNNLHGRPVGGLVAVVDLDARKVLRLIDQGPVTLPPDPHNYDNASVGTLREAAKPVNVASPKGPNYRVDGHVVSWRSWRFHFRMDRRSGLVVSQASYRDGDRERAILYQGSLSEIFVPYMDPSDEWYWRTFIDAGEYGVGLLASPLEAGADCPAEARFYDARIQVFGDGAPALMEDVICLFERPRGGPLWRHGESINQTLESRPQTDLVLRMIAQVGNYDYIVDWVFTPHGALRVDVGATGIDITKAVDARTMADASAASDTEYGTLVAPHLVAPHHDHFLCFRFDLDVDGTVNSFVPGRITRRSLPEGSPRRSLWVWDAETVARREAEARMRIDLERPALWRIVNPERLNALGNPTSYVISPERVIAPLLSADDPPQQRAAFTDYHLWVTPYAPGERYAAGRFPNQSRGGDGLPAWTRANRSIEKTDLVAWYTMGFRHVTAAEDWPVLATKWSSVTIRPFNFFDRNPTINLRSP